jgi:hypothetical protein
VVFHLEKDQRKTAVAAGVIGNIMEWYDDGHPHSGAGSVAHI